jgi:parallel beta-helix repeat protein
MARKIVFEAAIFILLMVTIAMKYNKVAVATTGTIIVPNDYPTIQAAINAANSGYVIKVSARIYNENLLVNKSISIIGENSVNTVIYGNGNGHVINIISSNVIISGFTIQNATNWPYCGISIFRCNSIVINNTILKDNYYGLQLTQSNNSRIFNNTFINNSFAGVYVHDISSNNAFFENTIQNNFIGLLIQNSPSNIFYHNNLIDNTYQLQTFSSLTIWDNGAEGNYWSDYDGQDALFPWGIGDSQYLAAGDNYPLMGVFTNFTIAYESQKYHLSTISNSTILNFQFDELHIKASFNITGPNGTIGFCRIIMPLTLTQNMCVILIDGKIPLLIRNWTVSTDSYWYLLYKNTENPKTLTIELGFQRNGDGAPSLIPIFAATVMAIIGLFAIVYLRSRFTKQAKPKSVNVR